jgi:diguanylate cyclase (GGDEF)-like protein
MKMRLARAFGRTGKIAPLKGVLARVRRLPQKLASSARPTLARRLGAPTLRRKLLMTFMSLAAMVGLCGSVGLLFFERIAGSVSVLSEVTSPLLIESMALIGNSDRMQAATLDSASYVDASGEQLSVLSELDAEGREHVSRLRALSERAGVWQRFEPVEQLRRSLFATQREIIEARARKAKADAALREGHGRVAAKVSLVDAALIAMGHQIEGAVAGGAEVLTGSANPQVSAIDALLALRSTYNLVRATGHLRDLAQSAASAAGDLDLALIEGEARRLFVRTSAPHEKLASLVRTPEQEVSLVKINESLEALRVAFVGEGGLVAKKREGLAASARLTARQKTSSEIETTYEDLLTGVAAAVRSGNNVSKLQTAAAIAQGRAAIVMVVAVSALFALGAGLFLTHSITGPLDRLTKHVRAIGERADLVEIADRSLTGASDEVGDLSRSFNSMIAELASARRQLIARSEAEIAKQMERLEAALTNMSQGLCMFDHDQRVIVSNRRYAETYGIAPERIISGMSLREILEQRLSAGGYYGNSETYVERDLAACARPEPTDSHVELNNGRIIHVVHRPMQGGGWVATHEDVTERRLVEAKIAHMARHDALTDLPNRLFFRERIEQALERVPRGQGVAVLCLDLDNFKRVNDTLGHPTGDALLQAVAGRLARCVRDSDTVARLGGDEFAVIQVATGASDASALAQRIIDAISLPYELDAHQLGIGASVGIAVAPADGTEPDELMKNADLALSRAKTDGRGTYRFFEAAMDAHMQVRRALEIDLRKALAAGAFELHYQPLINLHDGEITGFEALLRWRHPDRGLVAPPEFIAVAEETGLIVPLGEWVLRQACQDASTWPNHLHVAVNLSPVQFKSPNLVRAVTLALSGAGLSASRLELEITESVLLEESEATLAMLHQFRSLGARISMDDFGTGHSSLSYLRSFPFDKIKIDRSFIHDLAKGETCLAIVRAVTSLGGSLGITTTAEGVETTQQLEILRSEGCTEVQGFLFSRPRPASELADLLGRMRKSGIAA